MARNEHMIAALKRERAGYVAAGMGDRVAQVDEQLKLHGYEGQQDPPASALTDDGAPKGRTTTPRRTATGKGGKQAAAKTPEKPATPQAPPADPSKGAPPKDGE